MLYLYTFNNKHSYIIYKNIPPTQASVFITWETVYFTPFWRKPVSYLLESLMRLEVRPKQNKMSPIVESHTTQTVVKTKKLFKWNKSIKMYCILKYISMDQLGAHKRSRMMIIRISLMLILFHTSELWHSDGFPTHNISKIEFVNLLIYTIKTIIILEVFLYNMHWSPILS